MKEKRRLERKTNIVSLDYEQLDKMIEQNKRKNSLSLLGIELSPNILHFLYILFSLCCITVGVPFSLCCLLSIPTFYIFFGSALKNKCTPTVSV